jgi:hypothetical protein
MAWEQVTVTESYWTVCWKWGFIPYPCKKTRTVTKSCADFEWTNTTGYFLYCVTEGCMEGELYRWSGGCIGFGTTHGFGGTECFKDRPESVGPCPPDPFGGDYVESPGRSKEVKRG